MTADEHMQINLLGRPEAPPGMRLTPRQEAALELVRRHGAVADDELGALMHSLAPQWSRSLHHPDERCRYCGDAGRQIGCALERKGLIVWERRAWRPAQ